MPSYGGKRKEDARKFEASLEYIARPRLARATEQNTTSKMMTESI